MAPPGTRWNPPRHPDAPDTTMTVRLATSVLDDLDDLATRCAVPRSEVVRAGLRLALDTPPGDLPIPPAVRAWHARGGAR